MRFSHVLWVVCLIEINHFVRLEAKPIAESELEPPQQLPIVAGINEDEPRADTMGAGGWAAGGGLPMRQSRPQLPPYTPRRSEDSIGKPKPRGKGPLQINCDSPDRNTFKLIEELYCEALSLAKYGDSGVHYRIHRLPV